MVSASTPSISTTCIELALAMSRTPHVLPHPVGPQTTMGSCFVRVLVTCASSRAHVVAFPSIRNDGGRMGIAVDVDVEVAAEMNGFDRCNVDIEALDLACVDVGALGLAKIVVDDVVVVVVVVVIGNGGGGGGSSVSSCVCVSTTGGDENERTCA